MADCFDSFAQLASHHSEGTDFRITCRDAANLKVCIVAPHAGKIEKGTSEIACAIASEDFGLYLFEGTMPNKNARLHITSHKFDEPQGIKLVSRHEVVIGIHGRKDHATVGGVDSDDPKTTFLGGLNSHVINNVAQTLEKAGFRVLTDDHGFPACEPQNICNRGSRGQGVQLELPWSLRERLLADNALLNKYSTAVRHGIDI